MNKLFYEDNNLPIYEYDGELYLDSETVPDGIQIENVKSETNDFMSFRRSIGVGNYNRGAYLPIHSGGNGKYRNGAFDSNDGFLPDFLKTVYKEVTNEDLFGNNFIVWDKESDKRFCIRQVCSLCEHKSECNPIVTTVEENRPTSIISIDLSAQEPLILSLRSKEPNWVANFALKHLKKSGVIDYLQPIFAIKYGFDPTKLEESVRYYEFFSQFDWNTDRLVFINGLIEKYTETGTFSDQLDSELNKLFKEYEDYVKSKESQGS